MANQDPPFDKVAYHASALHATCKYIIENTKVKPNYEATINHYHALTLATLEMLEHMQASIDEYNNWNTYGENWED